MNHRNDKKVARTIASAFAASLAESLTKAGGASFHTKILDNPDLATRKGQPIHFRLIAEGALHGACFVEFFEAQVADLATRISGDAPKTSSDDQIDTLCDVLSSATAGFSAFLTTEFGVTSVNAERATDIGFGGMLVVPIALNEGENAATHLLLYFDGELMESLSQHTADGAAENTPFDASNLKLVMDVELNVSLRFGQRQLPLREVLELTSGSVIGLDRQVDEPVELLLDGKVIARGEAVIVDGNYGLRITEVPRPIASHLAY
jgi:flagellar motor switch protein FliN/FliY